MKIAGGGVLFVFFMFCNPSDLFADLVHQLTSRFFTFECKKTEECRF